MPAGTCSTCCRRPPSLLEADGEDRWTIRGSSVVRLKLGACMTDNDRMAEYVVKRNTFIRLGAALQKRCAINSHYRVILFDVD